MPAALQSDGCMWKKKRDGRLSRDKSTALTVAVVHFGSEQSVQGVLAFTSVVARCRWLAENGVRHETMLQCSRVLMVNIFPRRVSFLFSRSEPFFVLACVL